MRNATAMPFPRTMLAPMEGVSSPLTRALMQTYAPIGLVCTPFIRITEQQPSAAFLRSQVQRETVRPLSVQLLGSNARHLAFAAQILCEEGANVVDLNFGCPSRQVMRKGVGAALLQQPQAIFGIVSEVRRAVPGLLSAKIRGGVTHLDESLEIARAVEDAGADFLVVHPRSSQQGYSGVADWRWTRKVKATVGIPVVGNGDCWYAADAERLMTWSGCDAVMLGRAALRNPWIFRQINELCVQVAPMVPTGSDVYRHLEALVNSLETELDPMGPRPLGALKEQVKFLFRSLPEHERLPLLCAALAASSTKGLLTAVEAIKSVSQLDLAFDGPLRLEQSAVSCCDD